MKKTMVSLLCAAAVLASTATPVLAANSFDLIKLPTSSATTAPTISNSAYDVYVYGKQMDMSGYPPYKNGGNVMVPLGPIAEELGFEVSSIPGSKSITLDNGTYNTKITVGVDSYYRANAYGRTAKYAYGAAPARKLGEIYVPVKFFTLLCNSESAVYVGGDNGNTTDDTPFPNPVVTYKTLRELRNAADFSFELPTVPTGYRANTYILIDDSVAEVTYKYGAKTITARASLTDEDISGDFNKYRYTRSHWVNRVKVTTKGNSRSLIKLATFSDGEISYSISLSSGISVRDLDKMIKKMI